MPRCKNGTRKNKSGNCVSHEKLKNNSRKIKSTNKMDEVYVVGYLAKDKKNMDYYNIGVFRDKREAITELVKTLVSKNLIDYSNYKDYMMEESINIYDPKQNYSEGLKTKEDFIDEMIDIISSTNLDEYNKHLVECKIKCTKTHVI